MIPAQNYEIVFKFVKVMPRKLVASFFRTRCIDWLYRTDCTNPAIGCHTK